MYDAALAFKKLFSEARDALPKDSDSYTQAMIHAVTDLEHGISINDMRKRLDDFMSPKSYEETKTFERQLNEKYPRSSFEAISGKFKKDFIAGTEKYGLDIDGDDTETFNMAYRLYRDAWVSSKGDGQHAMDITYNIIRNSRAPSCVNGITGTDIMMTNPLEKRFGKAPPEELRRRVCARAAEISAGLRTKDGRVEILPPEEGKPNSCIWHTPNGLKITVTALRQALP